MLDDKFHPYVDVHVGAISAQSVWDTGAGMTIADSNFIEAHPALFRRAGRSTGTDASGASRETAMYRMAAPLIGDHRFPPLTVAAVDLAAVNATLALPMDLILGYNALRRANWLFDFPGRRWAITQMR